MNPSPANGPGRILVIGRSPSVLVDTVEILRSKGYSVDATNQFDRVLDDYHAEDIDIVVFGGMVPTGGSSAGGSPSAGSQLPPVSEVNTRDSAW